MHIRQREAQVQLEKGEWQEEHMANIRFKNKMKIKKKKSGKGSVLTLSLARKVKNLGNSLCIKEGENVSVFHRYGSLGINTW